MSSVGICALLTRMGYAPGAAGRLPRPQPHRHPGATSGAAAMGVANVLCLTGDGVQAATSRAPCPSSTSIRMSLWNGADHARREPVPVGPQDHLAAAHVHRRRAPTRFAPPFEFRPLRLAKKIAPGAQFVQTQYCFDVPMFHASWSGCAISGLHEKCFILAGVGPLASAKTARWIRANVPGIHIPTR
jgi:5,10-methylenetetrahydrofolate reductase